METNTFDIRAFSIARYLAQGSAAKDSNKIGFELEHFVVQKDTQTPVPYFSDTKTAKPGVADILEHLAPFFEEQVYEQHEDASVSLIALSRPKLTITLEPGAQLEISIGPVTTLAEIENLYEGFREQLDPVLDNMGCELRELGYHPRACAHEIPLIPKDRYHHMDQHFAQTGKHGICMMRATASTQTSIDFFNEEDAVRKFRIAHALGPFFAFITDNAPVYEGVALRGDAPVPASRSGLEIPYRMARMANWDDCDPLRCLTPAHTFDEDFGFLSYAQTLLEAPAIFWYTDETRHETRYEGSTPFSQILPCEALDEKDIEHVLSMFFYDVRFRRYIEIRQADSMPLAYGLAFVALIKGIFYNEEALLFYEERFKYLDPAAIAFAKTALRKHGYEALVYQRPAVAWLDELIAFADKGLESQERHYLAPLAELVQQRTTLLERAI